MDSHVVRCSVGEKLNEICFQTTYVKKNVAIKAIEASEEVVRTIKYRVNMDEVPTICDHHFAAYHQYYHIHMDKVKSKLCSDSL